MNENLLAIVKHITAQYGEDVLGDGKRLKAFFGDLAQDAPKPLRTAFGRAVEEGAYTALKSAPDAVERAARKAAIAQKLRDEHGLDPSFSAEALDIMEAALFEGEKPLCAACGKELDALWKICPNCGRVCGETEPQYQQPPQYPQSQYQPPVAPQYEQTQYQQPYQQQYSPPQYQPQYQPPGGKARHGFTTFWLVLLTIAFGGVFAISIILFATDDEAFLIFSPPAGLAALGLFMLLHWKRAGFWIVCLASVISISILFTGVIYNEELIYLTVLSSLFLTGSVYGVLMLRGLNGKNAWEQFQGRTKHER